MSSFPYYEEFAEFYDSRTNPIVASAMILEAGVGYSVTFVGNADVHNRGNSSRQPPIIYPSPGFGGMGAEVNGALFNIRVNPSAPFVRVLNMDYRPPTTSPEVTEIWVPLVVGEGYPLEVQNGDWPINDNSGMFRIFIGPPRGSGWKIGEVALG